MERLWDSVRGTMQLELTGAQPEKLLTACARAGIEFWGCLPADDYSMGMRIHSSDYAQTEKLAEKCGCSLKILKSTGGAKLRRAISGRKTLLVCLVLLACGLLWSSLYIWDIDVKGNAGVSTGKILRALEDNGVKIGTFWPGISSEMIRAGVLPELPDVAWIAVNVRSSRAEIVVKERTAKPELTDKSSPTNVIAAKTGIISKMSVLEGKGVASVGDAVLEGETLITGTLEDLEGEQRAARAMGDVEAHTLLELTAVRPEIETKKVRAGAVRTRFALVFGEKRINFYSGSGKEPALCDKIISERTLGIPGVFTLPITVVRESFVPYKLQEESSAPEAQLQKKLTEELASELSEGGKTISKSFSSACGDGLVSVTLRAECVENIARIVPLTQSELDGINFSNLRLKEGKTNDRTDH